MPSPASSSLRTSSINNSPSKAHSTGSIRYSTFWQPLNKNINKLGKVILPGRKSSDSDLTPENLEAHDRRQAAAFIHDKNFRCSPYYRGLTDQSLAINRGKSSPGRETLGSSSSSSSFHSFITKMSGWSSSCYIFKTSISMENNVIKHISDTSSTVNKMSTLTRRHARTTSLSPQALQDFICNHGKAMKLLEMMRNEQYGHFIFEGPPGVGKRTMILSMLRGVYGDEGVKTREERKTFNLKGESIRCLHVNVKESDHHLEINLYDIKGYEKNVIVELIQGTDTQISNNSLPCTPENRRAIILYEADKLSTDALLYLKWLFERYDHKRCNTVFFCCSDSSKLQPIRPLCNIVKLSPPSKQEIVKVLKYIAEKEGLELPHQFAENIAEHSKKNLRQAIRSFEATCRASYPFKEDEEILTGWEQVIANIAKNIVEEQTPKQLYEIRLKLRNLTEHDISADYLFKILVGELKKLLPENLRYQVDILYEDYNRDEGGMFDRDKPLTIGRRNRVHQFLRIEEFIAKFMSWCKVSLTNNKEDI
ncbi:hypothetical protein ACFE04_012078 [Oxalis oulophora]